MKLRLKMLGFIRKNCPKCLNYRLEVFSIFSDMSKVSANGVRVQCCEPFLAPYGDDAVGIIQKMVTDNETWVHHYYPG
jgi:hypothetical protein